MYAWNSVLFDKKLARLKYSGIVSYTDIKAWSGHSHITNKEVVGKEMLMGFRYSPMPFP